MWQGRNNVPECKTSLNQQEERESSEVKHSRFFRLLCSPGPKALKENGNGNSHWGACLLTWCPEDEASNLLVGG